jgi:hypothetical protein
LNRELSDVERLTRGELEKEVSFGREGGAHPDVLVFERRRPYWARKSFLVTRLPGRIKRRGERRFALPAALPPGPGRLTWFWTAERAPAPAPAPAPAKRAKRKGGR